MLGVSSEDVFRVILACSFLLELQQNQNDVNQRINIVKKLAEILGVPRQSVQLLMKTENNHSISTLSQFLIVRTIQSIVKKVNRSLMRRSAMETLKSSESENKRFSSKIELFDNPSSEFSGVNVMKVELNELIEVPDGKRVKIDPLMSPCFFLTL